MKTVIIQGSARSVGDTSKIVNLLQAQLGCEIIDLNDYVIRQYDYECMNSDDDFMPLIRRIVDEYDLLVFATPVYWYSMSGIMKAFFDRITDCLDMEKETGRKLRGMSMALVSVSNDDERFDCLVKP
ncbi:MAG: flavodoxin family protein, partial [Bacteroidia bacterium]